MKLSKAASILLASSLMLTALTACGGQPGGKEVKTEDYPSKPVTIICPWGVGGGADVIARKISQVGQKYFDQPIVVENHTGASGTIGMGDAFDAEADGYTLVVANGPLFSLTPKFIDVEYELSDFTMLRGMRTVSLMVLVNPEKSGLETFDDVLDYGKNNKLKYATSSGPGGDQYVVASAAFISQGIEAEPVVLGSSAEVINAVVSGQVDIGLAPQPDYYAYQEEGKAKAVATLYPEAVETKFGAMQPLSEWGIDAEFGGMDCLAIRADVPQEIKDKLTALLDQVYADPAFTGYMEELGYPLWDADADEVTRFIEDQMESMDDYVALIQQP